MAVVTTILKLRPFESLIVCFTPELICTPIHFRSPLPTNFCPETVLSTCYTLIVLVDIMKASEMTL